MTKVKATPSGFPREKRPIPIRVWLAIGAGLTFALFIAVGLLSTVTVPNFFRGIMNRSQDQARADLRAISAALAVFAERNGGQYPATLEQLVTPDEHGKTYLGATTLPNDPWGMSYVYELPGPGNPRPRVITYGFDGRPGGEGDGADIDSTSVDRAR